MKCRLQGITSFTVNRMRQAYGEGVVIEGVGWRLVNVLFTGFTQPRGGIPEVSALLRFKTSNNHHLDGTKDVYGDKREEEEGV